MFSAQYTVEDGGREGHQSPNIQKLHDFAKSQIAVKIYQEFASDHLVLIITGAKIKCS